MMEIEAARMMFRLSFAGGFALAALAGILGLALIFSLRLMTLREKMEEMDETLTELRIALDRVARDGRDRNL